MRKENVLISIFVNLLIPFVILSKFSGEERLGPYLAIIVAIAFPLIYGGYFIFRDKKIKPIPVLGLMSIILTGAIGLMAVNPIWIAVKEALIPAVLGLAVIIFMNKKRSLIRELIFNDSFINVSDIEKNVKKKRKDDELRKVLKNSSYMLAGSFFISAILNFFLAIVIVKSLPGTEQFNQEIGFMALLTFPVIFVPLIILVIIIITYLVKSSMALSGMNFEEIFWKDKNLGKEDTSVLKNFD